jgi:tripartite-type tricarboxylate transporter receptor subunit TctC
MPTRRAVLAAAAFLIIVREALALIFAPAALAQGFPAKAIRLVVPYPPGGPTDALARIVAQELQAANGWTLVIENKPGASGSVGTREVARAEADGHTIVLGNNQTHTTNMILLKDAGYDAVADFAPIAGVADLQHALVVRKDLGAGSVADLVALAKKDPGKLNYGSTGQGSGSHLAMELFKTRTGTAMQHVPFRGAAPMALEIVAGRIDVAFATLPSVLGQIQAGEIKALAIASTVRAPQLKDVPLLAEQGVKDAEADSWLAFFAPAKTPVPALDALSKAVIAALAKPAVAESAIKQGIAVNVRTPGQFKPYLAGELKKWGEVVKTAQVKVD